MTQYRYYQHDLDAGLCAGWAEGHRNMLGVLATGGGKTVVMSGIASRFGAPTVAIAHRSELVTQISKAFARDGLRHRIIGQSEVRRACSAEHIDEFGHDFIDPGAYVAVASVDTLIGMNDPWFDKVRLWLGDEAHHFLKENKWGKAVSKFPKALGAGFTATPTRADGAGLGADADGVFHKIVEGPNMRVLIGEGYLCEYRIFAPPSDVDYSQVPVGATGDLSLPKLRAAVHASDTLVGDVVKHYLRIARGKRGITFAVDVESAREIAERYRAYGVPAEVVSAKTPGALRRGILRRFRAGEVLQLVNVDLFGEGFDVPACEVVSMVRKTESYGLYAQQFGRALRILEGKTHGIIIDHVGNVARHGLPDAARPWSLKRRERRSKGTPDDVIPVRTCTNPECLYVYERVYFLCPSCGTAPEPAGRTELKLVDGDLFELDPEMLRSMRGEIERIDGAPSMSPYGDPAVSGAIARNHRERQEAQRALRHSIAMWAGRWRGAWSEGDREGYRRFYFKFGVDVMTAQTLNARDAEELRIRVEVDYVS